MGIPGTQAGAQGLADLPQAAEGFIHGRAPEQYGTRDVWTVIPLARFAPSAWYYKYDLGCIGVGHYYTEASGQSGAAFWAGIDLPAGAEVQEICVFAYDNDPAKQLQFYLGVRENGDAANAANFLVVPGTIGSTGTASTPGAVQLCVSLAPPLVIRHFADADGDGDPAWLSYNLVVAPAFAQPPNLVCWADALIRWRRIVSPPPTIATFGDVPTSSPIFKFVEALVAAGIVSGCGAGAYCPDQPVTRGQLAVFLSSALGLYWPN
jgi:hypothetical protein